MNARYLYGVWPRFCAAHPRAHLPATALCARARVRVRLCVCLCVCVRTCVRVCACGGMRCGSSVERHFASAARSPIGSGTGIPRDACFPRENTGTARALVPPTDPPVRCYGTRTDLLPRSADRPGHCGSARALRGRARSALLHHHLVLACEHLHAQRCRGPRGPLPSGSAPAEPLHSCCGGMYAAPTYDRREHYSSAAEAVGRQRMLVGSHQRDMRSRRHDHPSRL